MSFSYSKGQMIAIGVVFLILPIAFVGLRLWARALNRQKLLWDDYMILIALVWTFPLLCDGLVTNPVARHSR